MSIHFTGHHIEITPALKNFAREKFEKLAHHGFKINSTSVILTVEKLRHLAEATILIKKHEINAHAESGDMYNAIYLLVANLDKQLLKHKDKMLSERDHPPHHSFDEPNDE